MATPMPSPAGRPGARRPQPMPAQRVETLDSTDPRPCLAGDGQVPLRHDVLAAQVDRVEAELRSELVDQRLERVHQLRSGRRPVVAGRETVCADTEPDHVKRGPTVWPGDHRPGGHMHRRFAVRPGVIGDTRPKTHELASPPRRELQVGDRALRGLRGRKVLAPREHQLDRCPERQRGPSDERLDHGLLGAERAADRRAGDDNLRHRQPEHRREVIAGHEHRLRARRHGKAAIGLHPRRCRVRLEIRLIRPGGCEPAPHDHVGRREGGIHVAPLVPCAAEHVLREAFEAGVRLVERCGQSGPVREDGAHQRRARVHRREQVDHRCEWLQLHQHQRDAVLCRRLGLGDHERDRLSRVDHLVAGERLEPALWPRPDGGQVACRENRDNAGDRECRGPVDALDARVGVDSRDDPRVEQAKPAGIGGVARGSRDLPPSIDSRSPGADVPRGRCRPVVHRWPLLLCTRR